MTSTQAALSGGLLVMTRRWFRRFAEYVGAQRVSRVEAHERDRALQRGLVPLCLSLVWVAEYALQIHIEADPWFIALCLGYSAVSFGYRRLLSFPGVWSTLALYAFLFVDPLVVLGALVEEPRRFAFLNPFLLVIVVRTGIRYGIRTMYLSWVTTLLGSSILLSSPYWRTNVELTLAAILMVALVPAFFASLIRKIHNIRATEEERARLAAVHELAVARNTFLAKVSHELRSPLQSIVSALDVIEMRQREISPDDQELIGRMRRSSLLLNTQLRDLLTLAKGEAGRLQMHPETFDAAALVEATVESVRELADAKSLSLVTDLPLGPLFVVADGARIDQVLTNLIINSIRYTEIGQVRVTMRSERSPAAELRFIVSDTGPGIPQEVLPTLFEPDKVLTSPVRRGEGSGIGLAIVRTLIDHLGGVVSVTSQLGRGTTFTLRIPAEPVDLDSAEERTDESGGRVLIVDDRDEVRDALASVIDELGFECDCAASAAAGANLLAARRYAAVLLDVQMPLKGGDELAAETRRGSGPNCATKLIAMSAAEWSGDASSFDACLTKPIEHQALKHALVGLAPDFSKPSQPGLWVEEG
jgi:signal transduction histidine kinase/CheY-like chemotaxis protein